MTNRNRDRFLPAAFLLSCIVLYSCGNGKPAPTDTVPPVKDSLAIVEKIKLGGLEQTIMINTEDTSLPVLLILHGGPGFSEWLLFRSYNSALEKYFVVVNWDQRGAGLSYSPAIPASSMTIPQFVSDAHELVQYLKKRFHQEKIYLLGHSWGSILGIQLVQQYPSDFLAYIGVGQVVNMVENERHSYRFTVEKANEEKNDTAIAALKAIASGYTSATMPTLKQLYIQRNWLSHYGGAIYGEKGSDKLFQGIHAKEKSLYNDSLSAKGEGILMKALLPEMMKIDYPKTATTLQVPVYFFLGRHDYNTPFVLAQQYFDSLKAPRKKLVWFDNSAHMIPFEEPEKFNDAMINTVLKGK